MTCMNVQAHTSWLADRLWQLCPLQHTPHRLASRNATLQNKSSTCAIATGRHGKRDKLLSPPRPSENQAPKCCLSGRNATTQATCRFVANPPIVRKQDSPATCQLKKRLATFAQEQLLVSDLDGVFKAHCDRGVHKPHCDCSDALLIIDCADRMCP
jgi:hypothetical protein